MLNQVNPIPTIPVKNLDAARKFYEKTLGLTPAEKGNEYVQMYKCGNSVIEVYKSDFAGTNQATALTFFLGDKLEREVDALRGKGVEFEHYEMPETTLEGDIHVSKDMKIAWFKDPDGNILCMHNH